jgi:transcriptional regulator with XRE-family HTH domain
VKKDNFCFSSAPRIAEERDRLGFTQEQIANACGVSRVMWGKYERGLAAMGGEYLFAFAAQGADINYILTGQRSDQHTASSVVAAMNKSKSAEVYQTMEPTTVYQTPESVTAYLSREEAALLDNYRNSPPEGQAAIKTTSAAFAKSNTVKKRAA